MHAKVLFTCSRTYLIDFVMFILLNCICPMDIPCQHYDRAALADQSDRGLHSFPTYMLNCIEFGMFLNLLWYLYLFITQMIVIICTNFTDPDQSILTEQSDHGLQYFQLIRLFELCLLNDSIRVCKFISLLLYRYFFIDMQMADS